MRYVTIRMSKSDANALGLLVCECGEAETQHFDFGTKPCAHCSCEAYREQARRGLIVAPLPKRAATKRGRKRPTRKTTTSGG